MKNNLNWSIDGTLKYTDPCSGCSRCYLDNINEQNTTSKKWWHVFIPRKTNYGENKIDYSKIINNKCGEYKEMPISSTELSLISSNLYDNSNETHSSVKIYLGNNIFYIYYHQIFTLIFSLNLIINIVNVINIYFFTLELRP